MLKKIRKVFGQVLHTIKHKGILYTLEKSLSLIWHYVLLLYKEYGDYPLSIILGAERAFRMRVSIFKLMCEHSLFVNRKKALWLGRRIRHRALTLTYTDPLKVKYQIRRCLGPSPYIQDGDWDLGKRKFRWNDAVVQLFIDNIPPSETEEYKIMKEAMENKDWHASRGCRTLDDLDAYFETLKDIYNDLSKEIYIPSTEVKARFRNTRRRYYPDEVCVSIDRNGEYIIERGGGHRLSIAQLVKIEEIPVIIIGKHYLYVKQKKDWISCHP